MNALHVVAPVGASSPSTALVTIAELPTHFGQVITGQYRVDAQARVTEGIPHLRLQLSDATGSVLGFAWPEYQESIALSALQAPVQVRALVDQYDGHAKLKIQRLTPLQAQDVKEVTRLLRDVPADAAAALRKLESSLPTALHEFFAKVLLDPAIGPEFITCRASAAHHHAERGGLLRHSVENLDLIADTIRQRCPGDPLSATIGQLGYLFHDVGKIRTVGTTERPRLSWTVRHETHNLLVLAPHLAWLRQRSLRAYTGLVYILEYVATPAPARKRAQYFPAEVVTQFDGWSAAGFRPQGLAAFTTRSPRSKSHRGGAGQWYGVA